MNPVESGGFLINLSVLGIAIILEFSVLYKAGKEVLHEAGVEQRTRISPGIHKSFLHFKRAKPATKLVFMEDFVATARWSPRIYRRLVAHFLGWLEAEGIASIANWPNDVLCRRQGIP